MLHCISISELCSAINSTVAAIRETSLHSIKLKQWNLAVCNMCNSLHETNRKYENLNSIKSQLHYHHVTYYSCSYVVTHIHEYSMETDLHLQISQHQVRLKHENCRPFISQLHHITTAKHFAATATFSCTLYSINNLRFTKIRVSWNGELRLHVPNFKMFLILPKFEWSSFSWSNFDLAYCNLLKYL